MKRQITLSADTGLMKLAAAVICSSPIWCRAVTTCGRSIMTKGLQSMLSDPAVSITRINGRLRSLKIESRASNSISRESNKRQAKSLPFYVKEQCRSVKRPCCSLKKELK